MNDLSFNRGAVRPIECLEAGWRLVKDDYGIFLGITFIGTLIGGLAPLGLLLGPCVCGIYLCLLGQTRGQKPSFETLFKGFDFFVQSLIAALLMVVPVMIVSGVFGILIIVCFLMNMPTPPAPGTPASPPNPTFLMILLALYGAMFVGLGAMQFIMQALFFFAFQLIVDRKLTGFDAVKMSIRAFFGNFGGVLALLFLNMLLTMAGVAACFVGQIFLIPITLAAQAVAYRQVFPEEL